MKERCDALRAAHETAMERGQAEQLQLQHDEQAAQVRIDGTDGDEGRDEGELMEGSWVGSRRRR